MKPTYAAFSLNLSLYLTLLFTTSALAQSEPKITSLNLVRADTGAKLLTLAPRGAIINLANLPTRQLSVQAITSPGPSAIKMVAFTLNNAALPPDYSSPYALLGSSGKRYKPWTPRPGVYTLTVVPYCRKTRRAGAPTTLELTVTDSRSVPTPSPVPLPTGTPVPTATPVATPLAVFPGATGFGTTTVAGSGRNLTPPSTKVFRITSLADSGAGTLRACIYAAGPRTCIFETSGRIPLASELRVTNPYLTVAGQTAPSPGIMLTGASFRIAAHDVLLQHLQIRVGDDPRGPSATQRDGIAVIAPKEPVYNVVLDHLSVSWAVDENLSTGYPNLNDVTISNSIISEGLYNSIHPDGPHSKGFLIGEQSKRISMHHNLFAHNQDRNPRLNPGATAEVISNFIYNWGGTSGWNVANLADTAKTNNPVFLNFIGNYYKRGPSGPAVASIYASPIAPTSRIYVLSNIGPTRSSDLGNEWLITSLHEQYRSLNPVFPLSGVLPHSAAQTPDYVLRHAGSRPRDPNPVDLRIKSEVASGSGGLKDCISGCENSVGGFPVVAKNLRPLTLPANPNALHSTGYTKLERWLHEFSSAIE